MYSILKITDGTTSVNLLGIIRGFLLDDWKPSIAPFKGGGTWQSSPLSDGRRLANRMFDNAIETFELKLRDNDQDGAIQFVQELVTMLEKAVSYWTVEWQNQPVWIEARGPKETNSRYAVIRSYTIDSLSNPYSQPFFTGNCDLVAMDDFTLIVEREHWTEGYPGEEVCVQASTLQETEDTSVVTYAHFHEGASSDDMMIQLDGNLGDSLNQRCWVGITVPDSIPMESGLRFPNVTVPNGATILSAYLEVVASSIGSSDAYDMEFVVRGESTDDAYQWGGWTNGEFSFDDLGEEYLYRKVNESTSAVATVMSPAGSWHTDLEVQYIRGLEAIVQEIVDRPGWKGGQAMAFFVYYKENPDVPVHDVNSRVFYSWDAVGAGQTEPILHITYKETPGEMGREATCTGKTFISDKHNYAQISHIFYYDFDTLTYSGNLIGDDLPVELLPVAPGLNDRVYFGIISSAETTGPFDSLVFDLVSGFGQNLLFDWWYSKGGLWGELFVTGNTNLAVSGETIVQWVQPGDWAIDTVNGVTAWWVQAIVTSVGATAPYQK